MRFLTNILISGLLHIAVLVTFLLVNQPRAEVTSGLTARPTVGAGVAYSGVTAATKPEGTSPKPTRLTKSKVEVLVRTSMPTGHYEFCQANRSECMATVYVPAQKLSAAVWAQVKQINVAVNAEVKPIYDIDNYGKDEVWTYPNGSGDCEDYALEKRRRLMASGIPASLLLIAVVKKLDGQGHAVLMLRTEKKDLILDNLTNAINPWNEVPYKFIKRQTPYHAGKWESIKDTRAADALLASSN